MRAQPVSTLASVAVCALTFAAGSGLGWIAGTLTDQWRQHDWSQRVHGQLIGLKREAARLGRHEAEAGRLRHLIEAHAADLQQIARHHPDAASELHHVRHQMPTQADRGNPDRLREDQP